MPRYYDPKTKKTTEVGMPELNPELIKGKREVSETTPLGIIDSSMLEPVEQTDFKTPEITPPYPIEKLELPKISPTPTEKEAEDLTARIQKLNEQLLGEAEFRRKEEERVGIPEMEQSLEDLTARLRDLQREAEAIPLKIQEEFRGRGVTRAGIAPIQAGRLRKNAIEALTVSSLIDAAQNRLTSAQRKVERAVSEKYDPIKEEIKVKLDNLNLILQSPAYSREQKERAEQQKAIQEAKKARIEQEEENQKKIWEIAVETANAMAKKGKIDTVLLDKIQNAKTPEEALRLSRESGVFVEKPEIKKPITKTIGGELYEWKPETGEWKKVIGKPEESEEIKPFWTKDDYKKLAAKGVLKEVADTVSVALQEGLSLEAIRRALAEEYGREKGYRYLDTIMPYLQKEEF